MFDAMRVRSPTLGSGISSDMMVKSAAPMHMNMLVRIPALLWCSVRSRPMIPPSAPASNNRRRLGYRYSMRSSSSSVIFKSECVPSGEGAILTKRRYNSAAHGPIHGGSGLSRNTDFGDARERVGMSCDSGSDRIIGGRDDVVCRGCGTLQRGIPNQVNAFVNRPAKRNTGHFECSGMGADVRQDCGMWGKRFQNVGKFFVESQTRLAIGAHFTKADRRYAPCLPIGKNYDDTDPTHC